MRSRELEDAGLESSAKSDTYELSSYRPHGITVSWEIGRRKTATATPKSVLIRGVFLTRRNCSVTDGKLCGNASVVRHSLEMRQLAAAFQAQALLHMH